MITLIAHAPTSLALGLPPLQKGGQRTLASVVFVRILIPLPVPGRSGYFKGEKLAGVRILLYWLTTMAWALGRKA
jgi:hypothetical protein